MANPLTTDKILTSVLQEQCAMAETEEILVLLDQIGQTDGVHRTQTSIVLSRKIDRRGIG